MSFGLQNLGVINQKQSPAIWQSDIADFPINFVAGRILIDTFQGGIYIDTAINRVQIQAGSSGVINYENGLSNTGGLPNTSNIRLGGSLIDDTNIQLSGFEFTLNNEQIATIVQDELIVFTPDTTIFIIDNNTNLKYRILAEKNPI